MKGLSRENIALYQCPSSVSRNTNGLDRYMTNIMIDIIETCHNCDTVNVGVIVMSLRTLIIYVNRVDQDGKRGTVWPSGLRRLSQAVELARGSNPARAH